MLSDHSTGSHVRVDKECYLAYQLNQSISVFTQSCQKTHPQVSRIIKKVFDILCEENSELTTLLQAGKTANLASSVAEKKIQFQKSVDKEMESIHAAKATLIASYEQRIQKITFQERALRRELGELQLRHPAVKASDQSSGSLKIQRLLNKIAQLMAEKDSLSREHLNKIQQFDQMKATAQQKIELINLRLKEEEDQCGAIVSNHILLAVLRVYVAFLNVKAEVAAVAQLFPRSPDLPKLQELLKGCKIKLDEGMFKIQCQTIKKSAIDMFEAYTQMDVRQRNELLSRCPSEELLDVFFQRNSQACASEVGFFAVTHTAQVSCEVESTSSVLVHGRV